MKNWSMRSDRAVLAFCGAVVLYLGWFAIHFAQERLYSDSSYYLFRVVNEGAVWIEHGRWVLALSQILPLVGTVLGLPMASLITLHSVNNVFFLVLCLVFVLGVLEDPDAAVALVSIHLIGLTHGLFCPIFELYYGITLLIVLRAVIRSDRLSPFLRWPLIGALFVGSISCHFLGTLLVLGLLCMDRVRVDRRMLVVLAVLFLAQLMLRLFTLSDYERGSLSFFTDLHEPGKFLALFNPAWIKPLFAYLFRHYLDVAVLAVVTLIALFQTRKWWQLSVFVSLLLVLYVLVGLYLPGNAHDRYREQLNFASTAWVLLAVCFHVLPSSRWRPTVMVLLVLASVWRVVMVMHVAPYYSARTSWHLDRIHQARSMGITKGIVPAPVDLGTADDQVDLSWSTSVESLLLSARSGPEGTVSLITEQDVAYGDVASKLDHFILRRWDILDPRSLNTHYFQPPQGTYTRLE